MRVPPEKRNSNSLTQSQRIEYLDQTRIHPRSYETVKGISLCIYPGQGSKEELDEK